MRYLCAALFVLMLSASASAQGVPPGAARMSADDVVARLMRFDRNKDFKIAIDELPDRMQTLVVRGDNSDDLMLDVKEIRRMTAVGPEMPVLFRGPQFGTYGFGDTFGTLSSRTHIENSIDDLRLAPQTAAETKRIALAQADEFEPAARASAGQLTAERRASLIARLSSVLSEEERDNLNAALARRPLIKHPGIEALIQTVNVQGASLNTASPAADGR